MKSILPKSVLVLVAALSLAGCSTLQPEGQAMEPASQKYENGPESAAQAKPVLSANDEELQRRAKRLEDRERRMDMQIDDYEDKGDLQYPGEKSQRQLEKEKIHRLAKLCIQANNTSPPCLDIVRTNARMGKFFILQESRDINPDTGTAKR